MLKAILFDIDNTLILFDEAKYFRNYLSRICPTFADIMPVETFQTRLVSATQALLKNNGEMSNAEYYMNAFSGGFEDRREEFWKRFMKFYETEYDQFQGLVSVPEGVRKTFLRLQEKNLKLVIASNPMFPLKIQVKRLSWAGIGDLDFDLVTHIENMSYCKPRLEYYQEICRKINEPPEACLMVGNDPLNDMIVAKIGMKTYLTIDGFDVDESALALSRELRQNVPEEMVTPDFTGPLSGVPDAVDSIIISRKS